MRAPPQPEAVAVLTAARFGISTRLRSAGSGPWPVSHCSRIGSQWCLRYAGNSSIVIHPAGAPPIRPQAFQCADEIPSLDDPFHQMGES
jgi:hypothetical protein